MKKNLIAALIYFLISGGVMFSWFHYGLMYGGGDVGLPAYNPQRFLGIISKPWWSETAPGFPRPHSIGSIPVQVFFSFLQHLGFQAFMIQALTFGLLMFLMGFGMYLLADQFFKEQKAAAFLAGFFYMVNPYMMVAVWHRFIYTGFFFSASLPILLLLFRIWIKEKKFSILALFLLINLLFSYMFTTIAYIITLWVLLGLYTLFEIFIPWVGRKKGFSILLSSGFALIFWVLINTWWLLSVFFVLPSLVAAQHSVNDTLSTLITIGKQSIIPYSLPGLNFFYLFQTQELEGIFKHPLFLLIPWLGVFFIMVGIYKTAKSRNLIFFSLLFIVAVFLAKGSAAPFGYFYPFFFEKFFFLGILRDPFEKLGLLIPLAGSILFALGFSSMAKFFWKRKLAAGKGFMILCIALYFGIYHWPFWSGTLFGTLEKRNFVKIPPYYEQANSWISSQNKNGNILHLPLPTQESTIYRWRYGYSGLDSNIDFFTSNPSIFTRFDLAYLDNALSGFDLITEFNQPKYNDQLRELLRAFNIRFIVLHRDINWQVSKVSSPERMEKILDSLPFIKKQKDFGELTVYQIDENSYLDKIYLSSGFNYISGQSSLPLLWFLRNSSEPLLSSNNDKAFLGLPNMSAITVFPQESIKISTTNTISKDSALQELPAIRILPNSPLYSLILLKESIEESSFQTPDENKELNYAGKRLVEISKVLDKNPNYPISSIIQNYITYLNKAVSKVLSNGFTTREPSTILRNIFARHQAVLEDINQRASIQDRTSTNQALVLLREKMVEMKMKPAYALLPDKDSNKYNRQVYRYSVPSDGEYEILMADANVAKLYQNNLSQLDLQIDNVFQTKNAQFKDDLISFGTVYLTKGQHEISFGIQSSLNLIQNKPEEIDLFSGQHEPRSYDVKVSPFFPNSSYQLTFDYWTKAGIDPVIRTIEDSDSENYLATDALNKQRDYQFMAQVEYNYYNKYWKPYTIYITPRKNSSSLSFQFVSLPWDDCALILAEKILCNKPEIVRNFQQPSTVAVRNINVYRLLDNLLILRRQFTDKPSPPAVSLAYSQTKPLVYEGTITVDKPEYLFFAETFHNDWDLTLIDGNKEFKQTKHFFGNMYGNAWFVDKKGTYKFRISFSPEKYLYLGIYISVSSFAVFLLIWILSKQLKRNDKIS